MTGKESVRSESNESSVEVIVKHSHNLWLILYAASQWPSRNARFTLYHQTRSEKKIVEVVVQLLYLYPESIVTK